ncbi:MAG: hypothetical protein D6727_09035 [Gammaproteobacteria bacterium]|nr:MAG: hypothetical protein D6727_09035 [Gammaproteobacteria bacterium]
MNEDQAHELAVQLAMNSDAAPVEIVVPLAFFLAIAVPICLNLYFRYRARREIQQTIRAAIERGQELTPDILDRIGQGPQNAPMDTRRRDLRRGIILLGVGVGLAIFGFLDNERDLIAIAGLPSFIGLAFLVLWYLDRHQEPADGRRADDRDR